MKKADLKAALDELGIEYGAKDTVADLKDLLADAEEAEEAQFTDAADTATSFADVTGLCRQCGRLADHKHIGV